MTFTNEKLVISKSLNKKDYLELYQQMLSIRKFEEKAGQLYGMGLIGGFCHLCIGQEAIAVGTRKVMIKDDSVITTYRAHGLMLASGSDPSVVMGELMGRQIGCSKGKGGSMHMFDTENKFYGGHGIVGASAPLGAGIAFAHKYENTPGVCLTFFGDGAANQGQVFEAFNMAALWKLPVLFIIENNEYAMGTAVKRATSSKDFYQRGESLGIPGMQVDGMDVFSVMEGCEKALSYIRSGKGPVLIEMKTYRYRGHSMSDPAKYRTKEEVNKVKETRDPISHLEEFILDKKYASKKDLESLEEKIVDELSDMIDLCKDSPEPDYEELWTDVLLDN